MDANTPAGDGQHDFDFFLGRWRAENRRLKGYFCGSSEWMTFGATHECIPLLQGLGNMDELHSDTGDVLGMSIRFFNKVTGRWHIWWISSRDGVLQPPVVGGFKGGVGVFEGTDEIDGRAIHVRYVWSEISSDRAKWHQEFSPDAGETWETNWIMQFSRIP